jgi:hypothetical protein
VAAKESIGLASESSFEVSKLGTNFELLAAESDGAFKTAVPTPAISKRLAVTIEKRTSRR